jgi:hypothetical protein
MIANAAADRSKPMRAEDKSRATEGSTAMRVKTPEPFQEAASGDPPSTRAAGSTRARATARGLNWAFYWTLAFIAFHAYWYLGGRVGFGDQADPLPGAPTSPGDWIFYIVTGGMFAAGLAVPSALASPWGRRLPRRLLVWSMWIGCAVLVARGGSGFLDDGLRFTGLLDTGLTGLTNKDASLEKYRAESRAGLRPARAGALVIASSATAAVVDRVVVTTVRPGAARLHETRADATGHCRTDRETCKF